MDRATITICLVNTELNRLLTAGLSNEQLEKLEDDIRELINKATKQKKPKPDLRINQNYKSETSTPSVTTLPSEDDKKTKVVKPKISEKKEKAAKTNPSKDEIVAASKKRVRWDCKSCVNNKDKGEPNTICSLCEDEYNKIEKTNTYYKRRIDTPMNCGECPNIKFSEELGKNICSLNYFENGCVKTDMVVRNNYMTKNRPSFCKL